MQGFFIQGLDPILPGCAGTSTLSRRATLDPRWLHEPQPINNQLVELEFPYCAGRYQPEGSPIASPGSLELYRFGRISYPGMIPYLHRVLRDLGVGPRGNSRHALAP